jgi:hypothetical protein
LSGTCSKCVLDFRVALFDLAIDEQYRDPRHTGDLFWKPVAWLALANVLGYRVRGGRTRYESRA